MRILIQHIEIWQWALLALGAFLVGLSKTGIAGIGILNVAIFALVLPSMTSVGVVLPILISADIVAVTAYRRHAVWKYLWPLFPWAIAGIIAGWAAFKYIQSHVPDVNAANASVARIIGAILLGLLVLNWWREKNKSEGGVVPHSFWFTAGMGILAGFTTMIANAAGPIMILYLLAMQLPKMEFIGTAAWYFLLLNCFKVPFSANLDLINAESFRVALSMMPFAISGALFGRVIIKYINQEWFEKTALVFTFVAALRLLFS